jgi:hypothetical protein
MVAYASARRVAAVFVAMIVVTSAGTPSAYAARHDHTGVKRLWSQFPLGPQLRTHGATHAPPAQRARPPTSAPARSSGGDNASGSREMPWWAWGIIAGGAGLLIAAIAWLTSGDPPEGERTSYTPESGEASSELGMAVGDQATLFGQSEGRGSHVTPRGPAAGSASSEVSDRALVRYAAAYAEACREGNPAPILAVTALVPPTTDDAAYSRRMIAEARRRDLLTSPGRGERGGELTVRGKALLADSAPASPPSSRRETYGA